MSDTMLSSSEKNIKTWSFNETSGPDNDLGAFNIELAPEIMHVHQFTHGECQEETTSRDSPR